MPDLNPPVQTTPHLALPLPGDRTMLDDVPLLREALGKLDAFALRLDTLLNSDDVTLDELQELVAAIKANRGDILDLVASKLSIETFNTYRAEFDQVLDDFSEYMAAQIAAQNTAVDQTIAQAVLKTGSTMTGPLTLSGDPDQPSHAARRSWVETKVQDMATSLSTLLAPKIGDIVQAVAPPDSTWKLCNGAVLLKSAYPDLFARIGYLPNTFATTAPLSGGELPAPSVATGASTWAGIVGGNGIYVALPGAKPETSMTTQSGSSSGYWTSLDGMRWTRREMPSVRAWTALTFAAGLFVAVSNVFNADSSTVWTSPDGITWTNRTPAGATTSHQLLNVAYGAGLFVATGKANTLWTSPNGITWTIRAPASLYTDHLIFGNGVFVGYNASQSTYFTSTDGIAWVSRTHSFYVGYNSPMYFLNGKFTVLRGDTSFMGTSTDGVTWTSVQIPVSAQWAFFRDGFYYWGSGSTAYRSTAANPLTYTAFTSPVFSFGSQFLQAGDITLGVSRQGGGYITPDGASWTTSLVPAWATAQIFAGGKFIALPGGSDVGYVSTDAQNWKPVKLPFAGLWTDIAYDGTKYIAITAATTGTQYISSPDGVVWTLRTFPSSILFRGIAYGAGRWVMTSDSFAWQSADGISGWTAYQGLTGLQNSYWGKPWYGEGIGFVIFSATSDGFAGWSADGVTWSPFVTPVGAASTSTAYLTFTKAVYGNGRFIASTTSPTFPLWVSLDGRLWAPIDLPVIAAQANVGLMTFGDGMFVITHQPGGTVRFLLSRDAVNWTIRQTRQTSVQGMSLGNRRLALGTQFGDVISLSNYKDATEFALPELIPPASPGLTKLDYYMKAAA